MGAEHLSPSPFKVRLYQAGWECSLSLNSCFHRPHSNLLGDRQKQPSLGAGDCTPLCGPTWLAPFPSPSVPPPDRQHICFSGDSSLVNSRLQVPWGSRKEPWKPKQILAHRRGWLVAVFSCALPSMWQVLLWTLPPRKQLLCFTHGLPETRPLRAVAVRPPDGSPGTLGKEPLLLVHSGQ